MKVFSRIMIISLCFVLIAISLIYINSKDLFWSFIIIINSLNIGFTFGSWYREKLSNL